jgi:hypothetical protein
MRASGAVQQLRLSIAENPQQIEPYIALPLALVALGRYAEAGQLVDSIIVVANAPPAMLALRKIVSDAINSKAPPGSIRLLPPSSAIRR